MAINHPSRRSLRSLGFSHRATGFSLVELMVALLFISILMAGMAKVFQASLNTFYGAGESLSSHRRNLMAGEMLNDDLNSAGMYLVDIMAAPTFSTSNPPFLISPNKVLVTGDPDATIPAVQKTITFDEVTFYLDQPLPFEGTSLNPIQSSGQQILNGTTVVPPTLLLRFQDSSQAAQVMKGMVVIFKDAFQPYLIDTAVQAGNLVTITTKDASQDLSGAPTGTNITSEFAHFGLASVAIVQRAQQVRYTVVLKNFDPADLTKNIPCLVRQQETYNPGGFSTAAPDFSETVITENVSRFKVYLSMTPSDPGQVATPGTVWGGYGDTTTDWNSATGILATLDAQLVIVGRTGYKTVRNTTNMNWFRDLPVAVRVDLTTRSTNARSEYQTIPSPTMRAYRDTTQTLVMVPRHFGLTLN